MARSAINYLFDADLSFRDPGSVAITANGATVVGSLDLDKLTGARGDQKDKLGAQQYAVVIAVSAIDVADGDETYTFRVDTGATGAITVAVGSLAVDATGQWVILLDAATIEALDPNHDKIELNLTIDDGAANTASITFAAWLALA